MLTYVLRVFGIVQGVGMRPLISKIAHELKLNGTVRNQGAYVEITLQTSEDNVSTFLSCLKDRRPAPASFLKIEQTKQDGQELSGFAILESRQETLTTAFAGPDLDVCEDCYRELFDPASRRYQHPFISCMYCGPRYSIMRSLPYDRETTTMSPYPFCLPCRQEYDCLSDRRYHAETSSCKDCAPVLSLSIEEAAGALKSSKIVAIKGTGGFHLACRPDDEAVVERLRNMKGREEKPFALLISRECFRRASGLKSLEKEILLSPAKPIVLCDSKAWFPLAEGVLKGSHQLGIMLPSTPIQELLMKHFDALIMTSANLSDEPIITEAKGLTDLAPDLILDHDREILHPLDDSVLTTAQGKPLLIRRSRGYVPLAIPMNGPEHEIVSFGADMKGGFAFYRDGFCYLSQPFGDLSVYRNEELFLKELESFQKYLGFKPEEVRCDAHPGYISSALAEAYAKKHQLPLRQIYHHEAHVHSVLAEADLEQAIAFSFDGTGFGADGISRGSEVYLVKNHHLRHIFSLKPVSLSGSDESAKNTELSGLGFLTSLGLDTSWSEEGRIAKKALQRGINTHQSTSMGRLFDAIAHLLGLAEENRYDAQAALALERAALRYEGETIDLSFAIEDRQFHPTELLKRLLQEKSAGSSPEMLARAFHKALAELIVNLTVQSGETNLILTGGVFFNRLLLKEVCDILPPQIQLFTNHLTSPGDGNIALGQCFPGKEF